MRRIVMLAGALMLAVPGVAAAQSGEAQALLEQAGRSFEMGSRFAQVGDHNSAVTAYRAALERVDRAAAMMNPPTRDVVFGRREIMLSLGEAYQGARRHAEAADLYARMAGEISGGPAGIPDDRGDRLHLARALRGQVGAAVAAARFDEARAALARLVAVGRAMQAAEPTNSYLTRTLAQDLQGEVLFRWILRDRAGSEAVALETLALFRALAQANPGSDEAVRAHFLWAYIAAFLKEDDPALWREAAATGEALTLRRAMRPEHEIYLREARARAPR